jgi:DNA excision repair protein ERCC-3
VHEKRGDKVLVFCDRPKILEYLAGLMQRPFIHGEVKHELRRDILAAFRREVNDFQTLFISRVGDVAIDLPSASVAIQIGYHFGSRRQEIQRLGRIMRPKDIRTGSYSAFFYSLVSVGTEEEAYAAQRRSCLVNLGLDF